MLEPRQPIWQMDLATSLPVRVVSAVSKAAPEVEMTLTHVQRNALYELIEHGQQGMHGRTFQSLSEKGLIKYFGSGQLGATDEGYRELGIPVPQRGVATEDPFVEVFRSDLRSAQDLPPWSSYDHGLYFMDSEVEIYPV
jgi:hypothetical protein